MRGAWVGIGPKLGLPQETRCGGTIAWNNRRHLEDLLGSSGCRLHLHTLQNPRLTSETRWSISPIDAQDRVMFFDRTFLPACSKLEDRFDYGRALRLWPAGRRAAQMF